ncbi:TlpA family protein disulfide reductase [Rasiella sp. SM2506]|uniref:TlpA family protein disulfide reductase n=1 Tax=Rasiella sp. SM2506 TaxID=3423914 RepID=UPI003D7963D0
MEIKKKNKTVKKTLIQYGIFAVVAVLLYATGMHTEVIGFAQRGLLATGILNPDVKEIAQVRENENDRETAIVSDASKADFNLKLMDRDGNTMSLSELKGKVIFMNFWATWCPPCIAEMPSIDKLHEEMGAEVAFVMLSLDQDFQKAKDFDTRKGYNLPIYTLVGNLPSMYQSSSIPTTYIIDANGNLALTHMGMADYSDPEFKKFLSDLK